MGGKHKKPGFQASPVLSGDKKTQYRSPAHRQAGPQASTAVIHFGPILPMVMKIVDLLFTDTSSQT